MTLLRFCASLALILFSCAVGFDLYRSFVGAEDALAWRGKYVAEKIDHDNLRLRFTALQKQKKGERPR